MEASNFEKIKWCLKVIREIKKKSNPLTHYGVKLILAALTSLIGSPLSAIAFNAYFPEGYLIHNLEITSDGISISLLIFAAITCITGILLIFLELSSLRKRARKTARVLITGLPGTASCFPDEILPTSEKLDAREPIELSVPESEDLDHTNQIKMYNAELTTDLFKRFILHQNCEKVYIGGLARIPFLVAYGAFLRSVSAKVIYFDKFHRGGDWKLLNEEDKNIGFDHFQLIEKENANGDIGIAIGFTTPVLKEQLPVSLREHTTILSPQVGSDRNLVHNQENLERISKIVQTLIDKLSTNQNCKRVHLFLSVQSTLAIKIGSRFQEGIHKNWVIHNYNPAKGAYEWALELDKKGIKEFTEHSNCQQ
ncbi:SAVED domain-containing protein [Photobacterium leiognathi]|uniref:SAVED domain-containing protein n=1 Tax=Photobacterium leiognathi TaxID=553611 RepID=UPI0029820AFE|nr:SAVED domain-containing protein [Photobacterium leiognathi]